MGLRARGSGAHTLRDSGRASELVTGRKRASRRRWGLGEVLAEEMACAEASQAASAWETASLQGGVGTGRRQAAAGPVTLHSGDSHPSLPQLPYTETPKALFSEPGSHGHPAAHLPGTDSQHPGPVAGQDPAGPLPVVLPLDLPRAGLGVASPRARPGPPGWWEPSVVHTPSAHDDAATLKDQGESWL